MIRAPWDLLISTQNIRYATISTTHDCLLMCSGSAAAIFWLGDNEHQREQKCKIKVFVENDNTVLHCYPYSFLEAERVSSPSPVWPRSGGSGFGLSVPERPTPGIVHRNRFFSPLLSSLPDTTGAREARFSDSAAPASVAPIGP